MSGADFLGAILARKRAEVLRRHAHARPASVLGDASRVDRGAMAVAALRRGANGPRVIAEIKLKSPSAGVLRPRATGELPRIAEAYVAAGAAAVSVLCDGPGFGGAPLDLRRVARTVEVPVLFKEFVLDPIQVSLARALGAHMVLLLVRVLDADRLARLVDETLRQGLAPVVEAANAEEVRVALGTKATIIGVNARDLRTFRVDPDAAMRAVAAIPEDRVAVHMSGITSAQDLARVARGRADAVLVGETLMRAPSPGDRLQELLAASRD